MTEGKKASRESKFPTITRIINLSLSTGVMPDTLKVAILLSPMLKKSDANFEDFQNFRPNF